VKVYSDWDTGYVDKVRIEIRIQPAGTWSNVYEGSVLNCNWSEITFASTNIDAARYSYHYIAGSIDFWLYDVQFYEDAAAIQTVGRRLRGGRGCGQPRQVQRLVVVQGRGGDAA